MINAIYTESRGCFGMPSSARVRSAWTRALPMTIGTGVDVQGTGVSAHAAKAFGNLPGTSVWSPPT